MKHFIIFISIFLIFESIKCQENNDVQFWYYLGVSGKINPKLKIVLDEEVHYINNATQENFHHVRIGFNYSFNKTLAAGVDSRMIYNYDTAWYKEFRPQFHFTLCHQFKGIEFSNRARFDYRTFTIKKDYWRYVNHFIIAYPITINDQIVKPYIANMLFMKQFGSKTIQASRYYIGIEKTFFKKILVDLNYIYLRYNSKDKWKTFHVTGLKVFYVF